MSQDTKILICGLGTLGSQVALNLHMMGYKIKGVDRDQVEARNLPVQPYPSQYIGEDKAEVFQIVCWDMTDVMPETKKCEINESSTLDDDYSLVVDAFDNYESRDFVHLMAGETPVVHLGFSPEMVASVQWDYKTGLRVGEQEDICELPEMRYWLMGVTGIMTGNVLRFLRSGEKINQVITKDFKILLS